MFNNFECMFKENLFINSKEIEKEACINSLSPNARLSVFDYFAGLALNGLRGVFRTPSNI